MLISGSFWRVVADQFEDISPLAERWAHRRVESDGLMILHLSRPELDSELRVLLDRRGGVIGKSVSPSDLRAVAQSHLEALSESVPSSETVRFELRSLVDEESRAVLLGAGVGFRPPLTERALAAKGLRLVDAPYVDVDVKRLSVTGPEGQIDASATTHRYPDGHFPARDLAHQPVGLVWSTADQEPVEPTVSQVAHALATSARSGTRADRLDVAIGLAKGAAVRLVPPDRPGTAIAAARMVLDASGTTLA